MSNVADIVIANPAAARVFERYGIDYCCHGQRPLDVACTDAGVDAAVVRGELAHLQPLRSAPIPDNLGALIGHIVATHHVFLRRNLPRLRDLMDKVVNAHSVAHPEVHHLSTLLGDITDDLLPHLVKEERVLFPMAIELLGQVEQASFHCGSLRNPISMMHIEHDRVGELLAALRHHTDGYRPPADACPTWHALYAGLAELEADTHQHVHLENNLLFPRIVELEASLC